MPDNKLDINKLIDLLAKNKQFNLVDVNPNTKLFNEFISALKDAGASKELIDKFEALKNV